MVCSKPHSGRQVSNFTMFAVGVRRDAVRVTQMVTRNDPQ